MSCSNKHMEFQCLKVIYENRLILALTYYRQVGLHYRKSGALVWKQVLTKFGIYKYHYAQKYEYHLEAITVIEVKIRNTYGFLSMKLDNCR